MAALVGKPAPDIASVTVLTSKGAGVKTSLKKFLADKPKTAVLCFVADGAQAKAAVARMEEGAFRVAAKGKAAFVVVSIDSLKSAQDLHKDCAITGSSHVLATDGKAFGVTRTPTHCVIKDGKVAMWSEEEDPAYMSHVSV